MMESDTKEYEEHEEDDDRHWQEHFLQLRKTKEKSEDCTAWVESNAWKKGKQMKQQEEEWKLFTGKSMCFKKKPIVVMMI